MRLGTCLARLRHMTEFNRNCWLRGVTLFALGAAAFNVAGCKSTSSPGDEAIHDDAGPYSLIDEQDFPQAFSAALVEQQQRCCAQAGLTSSAPGSAIVAPDPESGARYNRETASRCVAEVAKAPCLLEKEAWVPNAACAGAWQGGSNALGEPCTSEWECAPAAGSDAVGCSSILTQAGMRPGKCYERKLLADGDECEAFFGGPECAFPSFCHPEDKRCVKPAALGEPCATSPQLGDTCEQGALCDRTDTKLCITPRPVGAACDSPEQCESLACRAEQCREPLRALPVCDR